MKIFPSLKLQGLAVSIMTKLWAGRYGFESHQGREIFFFLSKTSRPAFRRNGYWVLFPWGYSGRCLRLYTYLHLYGTDKDSFIFYLFEGVLKRPETNYQVILSTIFTRYLNMCWEQEWTVWYYCKCTIKYWSSRCFAAVIVLNKTNYTTWLWRKG
jgi:hypothetical protein